MTRSSRRRVSADHKTEALRSVDKLRPILMGAFATLTVATPLIPTETVDFGGSMFVVMLLWWGLFAGWALAGLVSNRFQIRFGPVGWAWLAFLGFHSLSAYQMAWEGNPRNTLNMGWLWMSFGLAFFLARQLLITPTERRAMAVVMVALAVSLSITGYYQYFVELPATRAEYQRDPERVLRQAGMSAPPGTSQRKLFEDRLFSTEPLATFALTNSLAGFLIPWFVLAAAVALDSQKRVRQHEHSSLHRIASAISVLAILGCLVLTKSRSAWLALAFGLLLAIIYGRRSGWRPDWRWLVGVGAVGVLVPFVAVVAGGLDLLVVLETSKSFLYRVQYWRACTAMIADYPWFGCGPGNFQQYYTGYKLPEASETIAEPHNFLFEIWSTAGTFAWLCFVAIFLAAVWQVARKRPLVESPQSDSESADDTNVSGNVRPIYWGALLGAVLGYALCSFLEGYSPSAGLAVFGLPIGGVVLLGLHPWVRGGRLSTVALSIALVALLVNLLAAGGIGFASVSQTVWLVLALLINHTEAELRGMHEPAVRPRWQAGVLTAAAILGLGAYHQTAYSPATTAETLVVNGDSLRLMGQTDQALHAYRSATQVDDFSPKPWEQVSEVTNQLWLQTASSDYQQEFEHAAQQNLQRNKRSSHAHMLTGHRWLVAFRRFEKPEFIQRAVESYRAAVELYPNHNLAHAQLSWALHLAGAIDQAAVERDEALRLDALTPHSEQKLAAQQIFDPVAASEQPDLNAEQRLGQIRSSEAGEVDR